MMQTDFECVEGAQENTTLTSEEATGVLRYAGIKMSVPIFQNGVSQGVFPFAIAIESSSRKFIISKHRLEVWIKDFVGIDVNVDRVLEGVKNL